MILNSADIIRQLIIDLAEGVDHRFSDADWPVFATHEPNDPDKVLTVYPTTGILEGRLQINGRTEVQAGCQVRVRSTNHPTGEAKLSTLTTELEQTAYNTEVTLLDERGVPTANVYTVHALTRQGDVIYLGTDIGNSNRHLFTVNYTFNLIET